MEQTISLLVLFIICCTKKMSCGSIIQAIKGCRLLTMYLFCEPAVCSEEWREIEWIVLNTNALIKWTLFTEVERCDFKVLLLDTYDMHSVNYPDNHNHWFKNAFTTNKTLIFHTFIMITKLQEIRWAIMIPHPVDSIKLSTSLVWSTSSTHYANICAVMETNCWCVLLTNSLAYIPLSFIAFVYAWIRFVQALEFHFLLFGHWFTTFFDKFVDKIKVIRQHSCLESFGNFLVAPYM